MWQTVAYAKSHLDPELKLEGRCHLDFVVIPLLVPSYLNRSTCASMDYNFVDAAQKLSAEYRGEHASSCGICIPHDASESHPHHLVLDLNGSTFEVLKEPPSALEFARIVHISRPVVIKGVLVSLVLRRHSLLANL